jgi:electron transport complex protein RnfB
MLSVKTIDALLPQTQCTRCGYPRCHDYARALFRGETEINRCPPGGAATIDALATLLHRERRPLNPDCGPYRSRVVARIVEADCIGCTKCIQACPVDAILGGAKKMHSVFIAECTGCELCVPACPVDCIVVEPAVPARWAAPGTLWTEYTTKGAALARRRTLARLRRLDRVQRERTARFRGQKKQRPASSEEIRAEIRAAVRRVKTKRESLP